MCLLWRSLQRRARKLKNLAKDWIIDIFAARRGDGTGIRRGLKIPGLTPCGFESHPRHQKMTLRRSFFASSFLFVLKYWLTCWLLKSILSSVTPTIRRESWITNCVVTFGERLLSYCSLSTCFRSPRSCMAIRPCLVS